MSLPPPSHRPKVGVAAIILSPHPHSPTTSTSTTCTNPSILTSTRLSSHGTGTLQLPGGHLEHGESFADTAVREVREETGLEVGNVRFLTATNDVFPAEGEGGAGGMGVGKHYVTVFVVCEIVAGDGVPVTMEPTKSSPWTWTPWSTMWEQAGAQALAEDRGEPLPAGQQRLFLPLVNLWRERRELADGTLLLGKKAVE